MLLKWACGCGAPTFHFYVFTTCFARLAVSTFTLLTKSKNGRTVHLRAGSVQVKAQTFVRTPHPTAHYSCMSYTVCLSLTGLSNSHLHRTSSQIAQAHTLLSKHRVTHIQNRHTAVHAHTRALGLSPLAARLRPLTTHVLTPIVGAGPTLGEVLKCQGVATDAARSTDSDRRAPPALLLRPPPDTPIAPASSRGSEGSPLDAAAV